MPASIGIALCQPIITRDKVTNLRTAERLIRHAVSEHRPRIVTLPEFFNAPYVLAEMRSHAEPVPDGPTSRLLCALAVELDVYIVGGTIPELAADGRLFNTTAVWSPGGKLVATFRKLHMADVRFSESMICTESQELTAGSRLAVFEVDGRRFGLGICYDTFFAELAAVYRQLGVDALLFQSAYPPEAGRLWELQLRSRALDNQLLVAGTAGAYAPESDQFRYFGESMVVDGWGSVVSRAGKGEEVIYATLGAYDGERMANGIYIIMHSNRFWCAGKGPPRYAVAEAQED